MYTISRPPQVKGLIVRLCTLSETNTQSSLFHAVCACSAVHPRVIHMTVLLGIIPSWMSNDPGRVSLLGGST